MESFSPVKSYCENTLFPSWVLVNCNCSRDIEWCIMKTQPECAASKEFGAFALLSTTSRSSVQVEINSWRFNFLLPRPLLGNFRILNSHCAACSHAGTEVKTCLEIGWLKSTNVMPHLYPVLTLFAQKLNYAWCSGCVGLGKRCESIGYAVKTGMRCRQAFKNKQNLRSGNMYPRRLADVEARLTGQAGTNRRSPSQKLPL